MAIPSYQKFFLPLLRLTANDEELNITIATERICDLFNLSDEERKLLLPSKQQTVVKNRVSWARTYLVKAGLLQVTKRAFFKITEAGKQVLDNNIEDIDVEFLYQYPSFKKFHTNNKDDEVDGETKIANTEKISTP